MRRYYIISGILLIVPITLTAPVLVQEKREAGVDAVHIPEDVTTRLGKRGGDLDKLFLVYEDHFTAPESSVAKPSSSSLPLESDNEWTEVEKPLPTNPESVGAHAPPNPEPPVEPDHEKTGTDAPLGLSSLVDPTWFLTDHGYRGPHAPQSPESDKLVAEEPLSRPGSPTGFDVDHGYHAVNPPPSSDSAPQPKALDVPPPSPASSTNPGRRSMGADSRLENLQAVSDVLKGNAKESRRTAWDLLNAAQRKLRFA